MASYDHRASTVRTRSARSWTSWPARWGARPPPGSRDRHRARPGARLLQAHRTQRGGARARCDGSLALGRPVLVGPSRKRFVGELAGGLPPAERLEGTIAACVVALAARRAPLPRPRRARRPPCTRRGRSHSHAHRDETCWSGYAFLLPGLKDLVQILLVAAGLYCVLRLLARTRAMQMLLRRSCCSCWSTSRRGCSISA